MNSFLINLKEKGSLKAGSRGLWAGSKTTYVLSCPPLSAPRPALMARTFLKKERRCTGKEKILFG